MDFDPTPSGDLYTPSPSSVSLILRGGGGGAYVAQGSAHAMLRSATRGGEALPHCVQRRTFSRHQMMFIC